MTSTLFARLLADGFALRTDGETLRVSPAANLGADLRAEVAAAKPELIAQTLYLTIWRELERRADERRGRLPARTDDPDWLVLLAAYERLALALGEDVVAQLELVPA